MENTEDYGPYPPGYEDIEELVTRTKAEMKVLDDKIELYQTKQSGPYPRLTPEGGPPPIDAARQIAALKREKFEKQEVAFRRVEQATALDKKKGPEVKDRAIDTLFGNEFKNLSPEEFQARVKQEKDEVRAMDAFDAQRRRDPRRPERDVEPPAPEPVDQSEARWSMSTRFSLPPEVPEDSRPARKQDKDKDGPDR